jgi:hypothetical protein
VARKLLASQRTGRNPPMTTMTIAPETELVVTPETVVTAGLISYWRLKDTIKLDALTAAWTARGLDPALLPKSVTDEVAFGRAVREQAAKRRLVRPLKRRGAWAVVDERIVDERPVYLTVLTARFDSATDDDAGGPRFHQEEGHTSAYIGLRDAIVTAYVRNQGELDSTDISAWLVTLAAKQSAVSLRETGGIYFVPRPHVDFWRRAASAIESVSGHRIFKIPAMRNNEAIDAITEAMTAEAERAANEIAEELSRTGDEALGNRALKTRAETCAALQSKVAAYEGFLGVQMTRVQERLSLLSANIATAVLLETPEEGAR